MLQLVHSDSVSTLSWSGLNDGDGQVMVIRVIDLEPIPGLLAASPQ